MAELDETVTASRRIYEGKVINVRVDTVTLPNGKSASREVVEHHGAIAVVPILDDGSVVLVRQNRLPAGGPLLEIPAGSINPGEDIANAAHRELIEEISYSAKSMERLFDMFVAPGYSTEVITVFAASGLTPEPGTGDEDEFIEIVVVDLDDALAKVASGEIRDAKTIAGLLWVERTRVPFD